MIEKNFEIIYREFRLRLYKHVFDIIGEKSGSLSATEYFSAEVVYLLDNPTITEFADYLNISSPNAAYKVKSLESKGYITKEQTDDRRTFRIRVTDKFLQYYHDTDSYGTFIMKMLSERLGPEELEKVDRIFEQFIAQIDLEKEKERQSKKEKEKEAKWSE